MEIYSLNNNYKNVLIGDLDINIEKKNGQSDKHLSHVYIPA